MKSGIADMVAVTRMLNATLVIPELDKNSYWSDKSDFGDVFDEDHFIKSLRDEIKIVKKLPEKLKGREPYSLPPKSWSDVAYYENTVLPLLRRYKVVHFEKTDSRLANNDLPLDVQRLRCRVNFDAMKFSPSVMDLADKAISNVKKNGEYIALHLRYEMDMLSFTGCSHGCTDKEVEELTEMRYKNKVWKEKNIDPEVRRIEGRCPITPEETALTLLGLGFDKNTTIYIAAGTNYGGEIRMAKLKQIFPNIRTKEMLLDHKDLDLLQNHSKAALDYIVSLESDYFIPTYDGNMARVIAGHRRYKGFRKTITFNKAILVELIDLYENREISWDQFSAAVQKLHKNRWGEPAIRKVVSKHIPKYQKLEDYFYSNPQECLPNIDEIDDI